MREIRRPKPEIRKKPEIRNPSRSTLRSSARGDSDLGRRATEDGSASEGRVPREYDEPELRLELLHWPPSGFGIRISFGFRASDFELWPRACSIQNSEAPKPFLELLAVARLVYRPCPASRPQVRQRFVFNPHTSVIWSLCLPSRWLPAGA